MIPEGYRIEVDFKRDTLRGLPDVVEVTFTAINARTGEVVAAPRAVRDNRSRLWHVSPGSTTSRIEPDEARARAAALVFAADEVDRRS